MLTLGSSNLRPKILAKQGFYPLKFLPDVDDVTFSGGSEFCWTSAIIQVNPPAWTKKCFFLCLKCSLIRILNLCEVATLKWKFFGQNPGRYETLKQTRVAFMFIQADRNAQPMQLLYNSIILSLMLRALADLIVSVKISSIRS